MLSPKPTPITIACVVVVLVVLLVSSGAHYAPDAASQYTQKVFGTSPPVGTSFGLTTAATHTTSEMDRVLNGTLGFEKVFVVGLPERTDKRDALTLTSSLTGFSLDWINGVRGEDIPDKAIPFGADREKLWNNNLGSWRGHMNAVRSIVENNYGSGLIMEDDVDWDVRLKSQLQRIVAGTRYIQKTPAGKMPKSPYGDDWDLIWLGHCGEVFPENLDEYRNLPKDNPTMQTISRKYVIKDDLTLPPADKIKGFQNFTANPNTRWVHTTGGPICTFAYALSQRGARKVLYDLSVDHLLGPFDNALANLCRYGSDKDRLRMKCVSVTPPLFFHHKAKGAVGGDSDIQAYGTGNAGSDKIREKGFTENIAWPARNNIKNMMLDLPMESQWPPEEPEKSADKKTQ